MRHYNTDSEAELLLKRAENELVVAEVLFKLSESPEGRSLFKIHLGETFYSPVISHAYYAIFHSAKAYLVKNGVALPEQGQHQAVYFGFKKLVREGKITEDLLKLYDEVKVKAETLLEIFEKEEQNRTKFTYKTLAQANKEPAESSIQNAQLFFSHIKNLIEV